MIPIHILEKEINSPRYDKAFRCATNDYYVYLMIQHSFFELVEDTTIRKNQSQQEILNNVFSLMHKGTCDVYWLTNFDDYFYFLNGLEFSPGITKKEIMKTFNLKAFL